jgi:hypothetical protein
VVRGKEEDLDVAVNACSMAGADKRSGRLSFPVRKAKIAINEPIRPINTMMGLLPNPLFLGGANY